MELIEFDGLPETVDPTFLKWCLYVTGKVTFFRDNKGQILALNGVPSEEPDIYYIPENVIIANPRLNTSYNLRRDVDCVVVYCTEPDKYNFANFGGLSSLLSKTATMLADNDISINVAQKNTRLHNIIGADDENTKNSAETVFKKMYDGQPYSVVQTNLIGVLQSVPLTTTATNSYIVQLVELHQYILAHFYEALGIQTHDNMKKERLITAELDNNPSLMKMNINNIFQTIKDGISKVNGMFGTSISIRINPLLEHSSDPEPDVQSEDERSSDPEPDVQSEDERSSDPEPDVQSKDERSSDPEPDVRSEDEQQLDIKQSITININDDVDATIEINQERDNENGDIYDTGNEATSLD